MVPGCGLRRIVVEPDARDTRTAARLAAWAEENGVEVEVARGPAEDDGRALPELAVGESKRVLRVTRHVGAVLRPCTGRTDSLICCNLRVVTQTVGCPLDCSYCILQRYQNRSQIVVRADPEQILETLAQELGREPRRLFRVCTGQVADSLALEPEVGFAAPAVQRFARLDNAVLELKTKTDGVDLLLDLPHGGRTIVSFSLSPEEVVSEEHGAAPLAARLAAAARVARAGYLVAFHLDPMVTVDGEAAPFCALVRQLARAVPPSRVAYLSMGTVRFQPAMRRALHARFPESRVALGELLPDVDGKLRLLSPLRVALYRRVAAEVRTHLPDTFVYLCMEPERVWRALGRSYTRRAELEHALARNLHRRYGLAPADPDPADYPDD
jgi:spore photoproduct lyase